MMMMMFLLLLLLLHRFVSVVDVHRLRHCTMPNNQFDRGCSILSWILTRRMSLTETDGG